MKTSKFYLFTQNNSGGSFDFMPMEGIAEYVFIEALDSKEANQKAQEIGIYFNGCEKDIDCECCGDRWYEVDESDGTEFLEIYGEDVYKYKGSSFRNRCYIHWIDGTIELVKFKH